MAAGNDSGGNDRDGADAVDLELTVLDRLLYRNRSQHRNAKYFTLVLEVRRACTKFSAPKLPDLLAKGLGLVASVPDSRNGRARDTWVRSASTELSRMRVAAIACAYSLESIMKASKHLAHQVSQTYFMALSTVFLACLARLFACNLYLGGRLLQVHAVLLRTLLAQSCTLEYLSASDVAECRVPADTVSFLSRLREAGGARKATRVQNNQDSSNAAAISGLRGSDHAAVPPAPPPATPKSSSHPERSETGTSASLDDEDGDEDDTGEHIGRVPTATEEGAGEEAEMDKAVDSADEKNALQSTKKLGKTAVESRGGDGGRARAVTAAEAGVDGRANKAQRASGGSGDSGSGGADKKRVGPVRKKVMLASDFSDSSSEDESDTGITAVTVESSIGRSSKKALERPTPSQLPAENEATPVSKISSERPSRHQPSLFFPSTPRRVQQARSKPNDHATSGPVAAAAATVTSLASTSGGTGTGDGVAGASAAAARGGTPKLTGVVAAPVAEQVGGVGWMIDPTPTPRPAPSTSFAVGAGLSGRKRKGKKSGLGRGAGGVDRRAEAAASAAGVTVEEASSPKGGLRGGVSPPVSATADAAPLTGESSGVAADGEEARARAAAGGGGVSDSGGTATDNGSPTPRLAETSNPRGRDRPGDTKARRRLPTGTPTLGYGSPGGVGRQKQDPNGGSAAKPSGGESVPGMARGQPSVPGKKLKGGDGGGAGAKRSSSGQGRGQGLEEKSRKAKKLKKTKKTGGPRSPSVPAGKRKKNGGGRNAIDDIFGSLLVRRGGGDRERKRAGDNRKPRLPTTGAHQRRAMAAGERHGCGRARAVHCCTGIGTSKLLRTKKRMRSAPSLLGLGVYLGCLPWGGNGGVARASWIDPDTLPEYHAKDFVGDERHFDLVFSDEFDRDGRTFNDGRDPRWTAMHKNDYTNYALQFYSQDMCETRDGSLVVTTNNTEVEFQYYDTPHKTFKKMKKTYVSGMVQTWNKFCFTGGIVEIRATLPGRSDVGGLWPAMWLMGNLARATYTASSDFTWPWSYNRCNRSTEEQAGWQKQQEISACDGSVHYGFHPNMGRGAPEIDILEAMSGTTPGMPFMSTSLQVSPGTSIENRPTEGQIPPPGTWYEKGIFYGENSTLNKWFYGTHLEHSLPDKSYFADAVSSNHVLSETHFEDMHTFRLDWQPGGGEDGTKGYLRWYLDDEQLYGIDDDTLGSFHGSQIPLEPVYLLLNTAVSATWGFPPCGPGCDCTCFDASDPACECAVDPGFYSVFPAEFLIDSVRVYQAHNDSSHTLGCDTEQYPTRDFIKANYDRYKSPDDHHVMLPVQTGGGECSTSEDCNGNECFEGKKCKCDEMWTGPECRAAVAGDDYVYEDHAHGRWPMQPPLVPPSLSRLLGLLLAAFAVTLYVRYNHRQKRRLYVSLDTSGVTIPPG
eukprot:g16894.t1